MGNLIHTQTRETMVPTRPYNTKFSSEALSVAALCLAALTLSSSAFAALENVGFEVKISEKEMVLEHPGEVDYKMFAAWDAPYQRIANRNMPFIEVTNNSDSTGNLTEFSITIGDTDYNFSNDYFGDYAVLSNSTPDVNISSIQSTGDVLTLLFGDGGLAPGELVRFGIDIDPDAGLADAYPHADFRLVLFDMNNMDGNGTSDNAVVTGRFVDPNNTSMTAIASTTLDDYVVTGPQSQYFNQFIRPYSVMEGVDTFGASATAGSAIPEPSTAVLTLATLLGLAACHKRLRS